MRTQDLFLGGPLHGMGRAVEGDPGSTYTAETNDGKLHQYRLVPLLIAGKQRDVFVVEGYDLQEAQREAARFAPAFADE